MLIKTIPTAVRTVGLKILKGLMISMISMDPIKAMNTKTKKNSPLILLETTNGTLYCLKTPCLYFEFLFNWKIKSCSVPNWQAHAQMNLFANKTTSKKTKSATSLGGNIIPLMA